MQRTVSAQLALRVDDAARRSRSSSPSPIAPPRNGSTCGSTALQLEPREVTDAAGTRIHVVDVGRGRRDPRLRGDRRGARRRGIRHRAGTARVPAPEPLLRGRPARADRVRRVLGPRRRRPARRGELVGRHAAQLRAGLEPADRRRRADPARRAGRVPRLRPPRDRAAAIARRAGAARRGVRAGARPDGLPRRRRGVRRRRLARRRCDDARAAVDARAHRDRPRRRRHRVPQLVRRQRRARRDPGDARSPTCCPTTT